MKNILKRKRLNNKGFTLIELLAVIVILAVVMGVAATSVIGAMNNSRKSSLQNSASSAADAFRTAYAETALKNDNTVMGLTLANGYNSLTAAAFDKLNITTDNYVVGSIASNKYNGSFVYFNQTDGSFIVCLVANPNGSYFVTGATTKTAHGISGLSNPMGSSLMWACSNNKNSWT